ncbi:hypothetical protein [Rhodococcus pyridinivorans]|uniref:hypothetical protein n=1 Tax=Rhodococcus pyridinivorans TaxID=103816 RepID=UPI003AADCFA7
MPWFKVDDGFYDHPKVVGLDINAIGLWALAGSYCARHLTDGVITDKQIRAIGGTRKQAEKLVSAGLWSADDAPGSNRRYFFNDWRDFQPSRDEVLADRERARERMAAARAKKRKTSENGEMFGRTTSERSAEVRVDHSAERSPYPVPTRPDPSRPSSSGYLDGVSHVSDAREIEPPSSKCPRHINEPNPPACRACGEARQARSDWEARKARESSRARSEAARVAAQDRRAAIDACSLCDGDGYIGTDLCTHAQASSSRPSLKALFDQAQAEKKPPRTSVVSLSTTGNTRL